ncbi:Fur family transcriptional regulator [Roseibacillus ishigakijimensis]|nr:transcriptional repressor [Roseibacillus ishigakijimensis]
MPAHSDEIPSELGGLRMTKQRKEVYGVLLEHRDHPTAQDVFLRSKERMPSISLATVYNCLEALVGHGLVRQVNFDRSPSRYCPNLEEHVHFQDEATGEIHDVVFKDGVRLEDFLELPQGVEVRELELTLKGTLPGSTTTRK